YTIRASLCAVAVIALGAPSRERCRLRYAPSALLLRIKLQAARRSVCAARPLPRRVRLDCTLPPVFFQHGHNPSQLLKCLTVGHLVKSVPSSLTSVSACSSSIPSIAVRSTPLT